MMDRKIKQSIWRGMYIAVILAIVIFLYQLGTEPWIIAIKHWFILLIVMIAGGVGIVVQAASFHQSYPVDEYPLPLFDLVRIWSASALISVVAPIFAGLATRTTQLIKAGTPFMTCVIVSTRQLWMGLEYAALLGGVTLLFVDIMYARVFSVALLILWIFMKITRRVISSDMTGRVHDKKTNKYILSLRSQYPGSVHVLFVMQLLIMSIIYYAAFQGVGANLNWIEAIALSSVTVFFSMMAFVPNGLGLTDAMWVIVAMKTGVELEASVSVAILIRLGHLLGATFLYLIVRQIKNVKMIVTE